MVQGPSSSTPEKIFIITSFVDTVEGDRSFSFLLTFSSKIDLLRCPLGDTAKSTNHIIILCCGVKMRPNQGLSYDSIKIETLVI